MRILSLLLLLAPLAACETSPRYPDAEPDASDQTPKTGITISGSARVGVSTKL